MRGRRRKIANLFGWEYKLEHDGLTPYEAACLWYDINPNDYPLLKNQQAKKPKAHLLKKKKPTTEQESNINSLYNNIKNALVNGEIQDKHNDEPIDKKFIDRYTIMHSEIEKVASNTNYNSSFFSRQKEDKIALYKVAYGICGIEIPSIYVGNLPEEVKFIFDKLLSYYIHEVIKDYPRANHEWSSFLGYKEGLKCDFLDEYMGDNLYRECIDSLEEYCALEKIRQSKCKEWADKIGDGSTSFLTFDYGEKETEEIFAHSPDYRSVKYNGVQFYLTTNQARVVQFLHNEKIPEHSQDYILETINVDSKRLRDVFKNHPAWGKLIVKGGGKGIYKLNI